MKEITWKVLILEQVLEKSVDLTQSGSVGRFL